MADLVTGHSTWKGKGSIITNALIILEVTKLGLGNQDEKAW
jgi:hypothetical protein